MKQLIAVLLALVLLTGCALSEQADAQESDLKALYGEQVDSAMRLFTYYATNERNRDWAARVVAKDTPAWNVVLNYDYGWWNAPKKNDLTETITAALTS